MMITDPPSSAKASHPTGDATVSTGRRAGPPRSCWRRIAPDALAALLAAFPRTPPPSRHTARRDPADKHAPLSAVNAVIPHGAGIEAVPCDADVMAATGVAPGTVGAAVIDRTLRVVRALAGTEPTLLVACCLDALGAAVPELPIPVLLRRPAAPRALPRRDRPVRSVAERRGEVAGIDSQGRPCNVVNHAFGAAPGRAAPRRRSARRRSAALLLQRCVPEVEKAFGAEVAHTDRLMLARYDAPPASSAAIATTNAAHRLREFALSVNLNAEEA